jgi:ADP-ribose pyrophosphatase YjhB (NUDIX family)
MEDLVECYTNAGGKMLIPRDRFEERVFTYAFIVRGREILFVNSKTTGKKWIPGGGVDEGESLEEALRREIREEVGLDVKNLEWLHEDEVYFYYITLDRPWHGRLNFFVCELATDCAPSDEGAPADEETHQPHWVDIDEIRIEDLQPALDRIFPLIRDEIEKRMIKKDSDPACINL